MYFIAFGGRLVVVIKVEGAQPKFLSLIVNFIGKLFVDQQNA
jgi:hypothetical protein